MSKSRTKISDRVFELVATGLVEALERGTEAWPLPEPPMSDPDFPALPPTSPHALFDSALGILNVDRGMFDRHLNTVVELLVPHRMNLSDDPYEIHQKWLARRVGDVAQRLLFYIANDWLAQAFDPHAPNTDRWWLSIALLNGLSIVPHGQPVHQGYHLVESIALAERPGSWHTQPDAGPQHMDWNPNAVMPRITSTLVAHENGVRAARWLMRCLENGDLNRRLLLIEWVRLLLERKSLVEPLGLKELLFRRSADPSQEVAVKTTTCLAKAIEADRGFGHELVLRLHQRTETAVQRAMGDALPRLFRRLAEDALPLLDAMLQSEDEVVLAAASATVGDVKYLDKEAWADRLRQLVDHPLPIVRRNVVPNLREYIDHDPTDNRGLFKDLWNDGDEVVRTRLRELLLRMEEVASEHFASQIFALQSAGADLEPLWEPLLLRREARCQAWQTWLAGEGEQPQSTEMSVHVSSRETPSELPNLEDALRSLDD